MDLCTIIQFKNALMQPDIYLRRYAALRFEPDTFTVTKYFAECRADYYGKPVMVYAPITPLSMKMATRAVGVLPKQVMMQKVALFEVENGREIYFSRSYFLAIFP